MSTPTRGKKRQRSGWNRYTSPYLSYQWITLPLFVHFIYEEIHHQFHLKISLTYNTVATAIYHLLEDMEYRGADISKTLLLFTPDPSTLIGENPPTHPWGSGHSWPSWPKITILYWSCAKGCHTTHLIPNIWLWDQEGFPNTSKNRSLHPVKHWSPHWNPQLNKHFCKRFNG